MQPIHRVEIGSVPSGARIVEPASRSVSGPVGRLWSGLQREPSQCLAGAAAVVLVGLHLTLVARFQTFMQLDMVVLCWITVAVLLWRQRSQRVLRSTPIASLAGLTAVLICLGQAFWMTSGRVEFVHVFPLGVGIGMALLTAGWGGFTVYWRELVVLFCLGIPRGILSEWVDLSQVTAAASALLLWYSGFAIQREGTQLILPGGSVTVIKGCDGSGAVTYLFCLAVLFVFLFRTTRAKQWTALILAPLIGFGTNAARVAFLAVVEARGHHEAFEYWHRGPGASVWPVLPVVLFGLLCLFWIKQGRSANSPVPPNAGETSP